MAGDAEGEEHQLLAPPGTAAPSTTLQPVTPAPSAPCPHPAAPPQPPALPHQQEERAAPAQGPAAAQEAQQGQGDAHGQQEPRTRAQHGPGGHDVLETRGVHGHPHSHARQACPPSLQGHVGR